MSFIYARKHENGLYTPVITMNQREDGSKYLRLVAGYRILPLQRFVKKSADLPLDDCYFLQIDYEGVSALQKDLDRLSNGEYPLSDLITTDDSILDKMILCLEQGEHDTRAKVVYTDFAVEHPDVLSLYEIYTPGDEPEYQDYDDEYQEYNEAEEDESKEDEHLTVHVTVDTSEESRTDAERYSEELKKSVLKAVTEAFNKL